MVTYLYDYQLLLPLYQNARLEIDSLKQRNYVADAINQRQKEVIKTQAQSIAKSDTISKNDALIIKGLSNRNNQLHHENFLLKIALGALTIITTISLLK